MSRQHTLAALGPSRIHHTLLTLHLHLPWLVVEDFDTIRHLSSKLYEILMGRVSVYVVVAVLFVLKLNYETMSRVTLSMSAGVEGLMDITYAVAFRAVVLATREGLDVWLLGSWMNALVFQAEHTTASL